MTRLTWGNEGFPTHEIGVDRGVLYPPNSEPVPWNGLVSIEEQSTDEPYISNYVDGIKRYQTTRPGSYTAKVGSFTYPDALDDLRESFGMSYRTSFGNGYKIHIVYNAQAVPAGIDRRSVSSESDAASIEWDIYTAPVSFGDNVRASRAIIDTNKAHSWTVDALEERLYGNDVLSGSLPDPFELLEIFEANSILRIDDNGDGTWTATGPDSVITFLDPTTFEIDWESAVYLDATTYEIRSL